MVRRSLAAFFLFAALASSAHADFLCLKDGRIVEGKKLSRATVPNNKGFETYTVKTMGAVVAELEKAGFGFGKQTSAPGRMLTFPGNPSKNGTGFYVIAPRPA
jgi:hypothetical protein